MTRKPSYRFAGYTEPWEEKKLGEVSTHRSGTSIEKYFAENGVYKVISIGSYGLDGEYIDQGIRAISNEVTDKKIVKENELTMVLNDKTSNGTIIGRTLLIKSSNEFVVNQRTEIISPKEILDSQYAYVLLNGNFREQVKKIVQGGTQIYVNYSSVEQLKLPLPSLPEQTAIGSFFQDIDQLISLQQRKLEVLKEQKETYIKLLFPAKGQTKPALRFAGFEDEWKEVKLEEVCEIYDGTHQTPIYTTEGVMFLSVENIRTLNSDKYISKDAFDKNFKISPKSGDVLMTRIGDIGTSNLVETDIDLAYYVSLALIRSSVIESKFLNVSISSDYFQKELWKRTLHIAFPKKINKNEIGQSKFYYPPFPEQEAIGSFFQDLDKAIAKQEEKVNQLKESKQTLLRKMFI
ncbi:MAG: restriction endonuclease subunit S [Streptococcus mitis]|nr:restriction endonuclease subunit S [Streptococcus mitis]MDU1467675.1 restriction endonuclease subunit S [Streptococcus mitis]